MPEFLTTKGISFQIERIISNAEEFAYLMCYNFKIMDEYVERIINATNRNVKVKVIYGVEKIDEKTFKTLSEINNLQILHRPHLHAKMYLNEKELVLTSMNLYEYSENNNVELGLRITKEEEEGKIYREAFQEALEIIHSAKIMRPSMPISVGGKSETFIKKEKSRVVKKKTSAANNGYCIRCKKTIKHNRSRPLCDYHYGDWIQWHNPYYEEKYCHKCGRKTYGDTCYAEPSDCLKTSRQTP